MQVDSFNFFLSLRRSLSSVTQGLNRLSESIREYSDAFDASDASGGSSNDSDDDFDSYHYQEMLCLRSIEHPKLFVDRNEIVDFLRSHVYVREDNLDFVCFEFTPLGVPNQVKCELMFRSVEAIALVLERFHCEKRVFCVS